MTENTWPSIFRGEVMRDSSSSALDEYSLSPLRYVTELAPPLVCGSRPTRSACVCAPTRRGHKEGSETGNLWVSLAVWGAHTHTRTHTRAQSKQ